MCTADITDRKFIISVLNRIKFVIVCYIFIAKKYIDQYVFFARVISWLN